ncbi:MAG: guanyl-specific ribonuclease F1 [Lasallia pustulata]|uniref:ribonuclease T1 n=1 Tax=Lasallia pustulata TaxID=136370 RepID=A0A5M8PRA9_9LECA|nr:MAG: guanyl-specific ribonuclease F1 [Lasallia pustulata]
MAEIYYEPSGCDCDGTEYTNDDINNAATAALKLASEGQTLGRDKYPHAYNDYEHFSFQHAVKPYLEFPIVSGETYDGSSPGADRVVIGSIAEDYSSAVYCAVITHDGQRKNGFAECRDDTVNLRGKGRDVKVKKERKARKLIDKIEL